MGGARDWVGVGVLAIDDEEKGYKDQKEEGSYCLWQQQQKHGEGRISEEGVRSLVL